MNIYQNSIAVIAALISIPFIKQKSGNKNLYIVDTYQSSITGNRKISSINAMWCTSNMKQNETIGDVRDKNTTSIGFNFFGPDIKFNDYITKEIFSNLGQKKSIFIDFNDLKNTEQKDLIKKHLIPRLHNTVFRSWDRTYMKSYSSVEDLTIDSAELTDNELLDLLEYSPSIHFLRLRKNNLVVPRIKTQHSHYSRKMNFHFFKLDLAYNRHLENIDGFAEYCDDLVYINLRGTKIAKFPNWLTKIKTLQEINLNADMFFPTSVKNLINVKKLKFDVSSDKKFNASIMNWINISTLDIKFSHRNSSTTERSPDIVQIIPKKFYELKNLTELIIGYHRWKRPIDYITVLFPAPKNKTNLIEKFSFTSSWTNITGRYDIALSNATKIDLYNIKMNPIKEPIRNKKTKNLTAKSSELYTPFIESLSDLRSLYLQDIKNISEINFENVKNIRKITIKGTRRARLQSLYLKNLSSCSELREINLKWCNVGDLSQIPTKHIKWVRIENSLDVISLPVFKNKDYPLRIWIKSSTIKTASPLIDIELTKNSYIWFDDVKLLEPLTHKEIRRLLANPNISDYNKKSILELNRTFESKKGNLRLR